MCSYNYTLSTSDFPTPILSYGFAVVNDNEAGVVVLRVNLQVSELITFDCIVLFATFQTLSESVVPTRNYRYTNLIGSLSPMMSFTGDLFEIALPGVDSGHVVNVTVVLERGPCTSAAIASFTGIQAIIIIIFSV